MKRKIILLFLVFSLTLYISYSQVPAGFNYQALARNASGNPIVNSTILVKISILSDTTGFYLGNGGTYIWEEQHSVTTNNLGLFSLVIGSPKATRIAGSAATFDAINWNATPTYVGIKIQPPSSGWTNLGSAKLWSVPYAMVSDKTNAVSTGSKLSVTGKNDLGTEALFEVKRQDGQTVFAVYPDAVNVYVPRSAKGVKGGFAIGGFDGTKSEPQDYFRVTPDSVRVYIDKTPQAVKGVKGGFAIGGYGGGKGIEDTYFNLTGAGVNSVSIGNNNTASNSNSIAFGNSNTSSGSNSIAIGNNAFSSNTLSTAMGYFVQATGVKSVSIGANYYKTIFIKPLTFIIRPIIPLPKGEITNPTEVPQTAGQTKGDYIILPTSINRNNIAEGEYSVAIGNGNYASNGGNAIGVFNDASAQFATSVGFGNKARAVNSFAAGYANISDGEFSTAFGRYTNATSENSFVIGRYNVSSGTPTDWIETDPLFQIGNGSSSTATHDAFRVLKNGGAYVNGTNAYSGLWVINSNTADNPNTTYGLGIMSGIQRNKSGLTYYSGYFYDASATNGLGTYQGLWADLINTPRINATDIYATRINGLAADVAEYFYDSNVNIEPSDVVVADPGNKESVIKSTMPYQSSVLGVISTKPMMSLGNSILENSKPVACLALTGRVPVNVTDENGTIVPGDYLTTSSVPGAAMKWTLLDVDEAKDFDDLKRILAENEKRRNAIIGKAVESFSGTGTGRIIVLISLQ